LRRPVQTLTAYDEEQVVTYLRLLGADQEGADWREVSRIVLHIDPDHEADRAQRAFASHDAAGIPASAPGRRITPRLKCAQAQGVPESAAKLLVARGDNPSPGSHLSMRSGLSHKEGFAQRSRPAFAVNGGLF
jgi:hypothetical protein